MSWRSGRSTWNSDLSFTWVPDHIEAFQGCGLGKGCTNHTGGAGSPLVGAQALPMASFGCLKPLALIVALPCLNKQYWDHSHCGKWDGLHPKRLYYREASPGSAGWGAGSQSLWHPDSSLPWLPSGWEGSPGPKGGAEADWSSPSANAPFRANFTQPELVDLQFCRGVGSQGLLCPPRREQDSWGAGTFPTPAKKYQAGNLPRARLGYQDTQLSLRFSLALWYSLSRMCSVNPK